jgi:hypothetical protein
MRPARRGGARGQRAAAAAAVARERRRGRGGGLRLGALPRLRLVRAAVRAVRRRR